jgi:carbon storage regulator
LKARMSPTDTSSWWAIQASVRPWRTHVRIWLSWGFSDRRAKRRRTLPTRRPKSTLTRRPKSTAVLPQFGCTLHRLAQAALLGIHIPSAGEKLGVLVLTRKSNQSIMIGDDIEISVLAVMGEKVRIGIEAPRSVPVFRREVYVEIHDDDTDEREEVDRALQGLRADSG